MAHVYSDVVSRILADIDAEYVKIADMTITRGKIHKYLMITINYSYPGKVKFSMVECIRKMLENIPKDIKGKSSVLDGHHLFDTAGYTIKLFQYGADSSTVFWHSYCTCGIERDQT